LWKCVQQYGEEFTTEYAGRYQCQYGSLRPVVTKVLAKFLDCGDLHHGFARVCCPDCRLEYIREPFDDDLPFGPDAYAEQAPADEPGREHHAARPALPNCSA
jgi:hypothetical protein